MKLKKILLTITMAVVPTFLFLGNASAGTNDSTITYQRVNGVYFYLKNNVTGAVDSNHVTKFLMNGNIAYCIEPMVDIKDKTFNSTTDWNVTGLTYEQREYIEAVGYFGYEYPGHQNDRYWLAAQSLIWEKANTNVSVKFTTAENGGGNVIDLSRERNEILNLISKNKIKPSFDSSSVDGNIGDEITLTDNNNVLTNFDLNYNGKHKISKEGNQLKIKLDSTTTGKETVRFRQHLYDNKSSMIYYQGSSQKLAVLRSSDPTVSSFTLQSHGGKVEIDKKGEKVILDDGSYKYETIQLPNVVFGLYANEDIKNENGDILYKKYQLIDTLTTNELGIATLENLYYGKYFLIEGESSLGNMINIERYYFEITKDDIIDGRIVKKFDFQNYLPKGTLEFTKTDIVTGNVIPGTIIQIFTEDDRLIFTGTSDNNGKINIPNLPIGKYYIIEKMPADGYELTNEKILFEITENGQIVKANMTNKQIIKVPDTLSENHLKNISRTIIFISSILLILTCIVLKNENKDE